MQDKIQQFIEYLEVKKAVSENTKLAYRSDLKKLAEYFAGQGIVSADQITETNLNSYILHLEKQNLSNATISRTLTVIRRYFDFLFKRHIITEDITDGLKAPKVVKGPSPKLEEGSFEKLLNMPDPGTAKGIRDLSILILLYDTGIQFAELLKLKRSDVNLELGFIRCSRENNERIVSLSSDTVVILRQYMKYSRPKITALEKTFLFPNPKGGPLTRQGVWKMIKKHIIAAGMDPSIMPKMIKS